LAFLGIIMSFGCFASIIILSMPSTCCRAHDARRQSDITQINLAMKMYYDANNNQYLQSETLPKSIGNILNPFPKEQSGGPCSSYQWISNMNDSQRFCVWACLKDEDGKFIVSSQKGVTTTDKAPNNLDCF
jgi:hypothetical protein